MKKEEKKIVEVEITDEEQKEEKKKKGLILKVAIFAGCLVLAGGGITTGVLIKKNNISPDKKVVIAVEPTIHAKGNEIVDVPTIAPIGDEIDPGDELDPVVVGPTVTPDEKDPNEIDNGDDVMEVTPEPTVVPAEPTVAPTPTPVPSNGGNNQGGNDVVKVTPTPEPTKAPTPKPTVAPTPTPVAEQDDEYDKAMYDKFIKAGKDFLTYLKDNGYNNSLPEDAQYGIYAYEYLVNVEYINEATAKKLVEDGIVDMENFNKKLDTFFTIAVRCLEKMTKSGSDFIDLSKLHLDKKDAKHVKEYYEAVNSTNNMDIPMEDFKKYVDDFIYASKNDEKTRFSLTYDKMSMGVKNSYFLSANIFSGVLGTFRIDGIDYRSIEPENGRKNYYDYINEVSNKYKSFNMSHAPKVYTKRI